VLFSNAQIAELINGHFEPAWQSVRPAAMIRVDFGNGQTITRTLNGNVATYVCGADGTVLDVIPGVYDPASYRERLQQAVLLHRWAGERAGSDREPGRLDPVRLKPFLTRYHTQQAEALREHGEPKMIVDVPDVPGSIRVIEAGLKLVLKSSRRGVAAGIIAASDQRGTPAGDRPAAASANGRSFDLPPELASRLGRVRPEMLSDDTRHNESVRRLQVHEYLAAHSPARPDDMTRWLYREVLHTDLDDPHLGLGKLLFATYPFDDEGQ
jgi:hypothetical protein